MQPHRYHWLWFQHRLIALPAQICKPREGRYIYMCVCVHGHVSVTQPGSAGLPCQHGFLQALFPVGLPLSCSLHRALREVAAAEHRGVSTLEQSLSVRALVARPGSSWGCRTTRCVWRKRLLAALLVRPPRPSPYCVCPCVWGCFSLLSCLPAPLVSPQRGAVAVLPTQLGGDCGCCAQGVMGQDGVAGSYGCKTATSGEEPLPVTGMEAGG